MKHFFQFFAVVMAVVVCLYGCTQVKTMLNNNPELIVKINDLISDVVKIAGSELIEVAMRGDSQEKLYRYEGKRLKSSGGYSVRYLLVRDSRVIGIGSK